MNSLVVFMLNKHKNKWSKLLSNNFRDEKSLTNANVGLRKLTGIVACVNGIFFQKFYKIWKNLNNCFYR